MIASQERLDRVIDKLRSQGHRMTPQRLAVLKVLLDRNEHLTVEEIHDRIKVDFPMTSLATIYKTVGTLKEIGEVMELSFSDESNRYDGEAYPHPHLVCVRCKKILDVNKFNIGEVPADIAGNTGYEIVGHRFDIFGVCPECQNERRIRDSK